MRHFFLPWRQVVNKPVCKNLYKSSNSFSEHKQFDEDGHIFWIFQTRKMGLKPKLSKQFTESSAFRFKNLHEKFGQNQTITLMYIRIFFRV